MRTTHPLPSPTSSPTGNANVLSGDGFWSPKVTELAGGVNLSHRVFLSAKTHRFDVSRQLPVLRQGQLEWLEIDDVGVGPSPILPHARTSLLMRRLRLRRKVMAPATTKAANRPK